MDEIKPLQLNGSEIAFVSQIKYLGMNIESNPDLIFTADSDLRSFYRSANSVLNVLKKPDEAVQMQLLYTNFAAVILNLHNEWSVDFVISIPTWNLLGNWLW